MKKYILVGLFFVAILFNVTKVEAQQGCCSHHGGVYGCNENGRTICKEISPVIKYVSPYQVLGIS